MAGPITMDYETIIQDIMNNYSNPCDDEIPVGSYRRVIWEGHTTDYPEVGVEWDTEIIPIGTHLYTAEPFGHRSTNLPVVNTDTTGTSILVAKIGYYFLTQQAVDLYIDSIGATKTGTNDWYGADLSKSALFKNPGELKMYQAENSGGYLSGTTPVCDQRIRQRYDSTTGGFTLVDFDWSGDRVAYMKHDTTGQHNCKYVGMRTNTNADTSIPPVPPALPSTYGQLPSEIASLRTFGIAALPSVGCIPATVGFPYTNISNAMLEAWNETRNSFKLVFDMLTGGIQQAEDSIGTVFNNLSIAMEELSTGALALSQQAWQTAMKGFREVMNSAFGIVGGAFDLVKNMIPAITILGVSINIYDLIFGDSSVQSLKDSFMQVISNGVATADGVIQGIYSAIGSSYRYTVEYVKATARDLVDACTALFDWCVTMFQNGCVALIDLFGRMLQIWTMPPEVPNPLWSAVLAIRGILTQIKPLDVILGGNFPGFTSADLYQMAQEKVKEKIDQVYAQVRQLYSEGQDLYNQLTTQISERDGIQREFNRYMNWMYGTVTEAGTAAYEASLAAANQAIAITQQLYETGKETISNLQQSISDTYSMAMEELKNLPVMETINEFLGYCGLSVDSLLQTYENAVTGAQSLYKDFIDSSRSFKDTCKIIYNQLCTLALSKITQYVNKLLSLIGLAINFGSISVCVPMVKY